MSEQPPIDPVCSIHGKKMSEHRCLYCCLCFKSLEEDECSFLPNGKRTDVCAECAEQEQKVILTTCGSLRKENEELKRKQQDGATLITTAAEVMGEIAALRKENGELRGNLSTWKEAMRLLASDQLAEELINLRIQKRQAADLSKSVWDTHEKQFDDLRAQLKSANEQLDEARKALEEEIKLAESCVASEKLAGNVVKENYAKGWVAGLLIAARVLSLTARHRSEAFLRTKGLWRDEWN